MRFRFFAPAVFGLGFLAAPAFAQDAPASDEGFSGLYVGGSIGVPAQPNDRRSGLEFDTDRDGRFDNNVNTTANANAFSPGFCGGAANSNVPTQGCRSDSDGIEYFGRVGADRQFGHIVVGVLGEVGKSEARDSVSGFSTTPASYTLSREAKYNAGLRARVGYTPNNRTLFYATGGGAYAKIRNRFTTTNTANSFTGNGNSDAWGYSGGGGIEQKLGRHFSIGLEYLYTTLKDDNYRIAVGQGTAPATNPFLLVNSTGTDLRRSDDNFRTHAIRATAAFRF